MNLVLLSADIYYTASDVVMCKSKQGTRSLKWQFGWFSEFLAFSVTFGGIIYHEQNAVCVAEFWDACWPWWQCVGRITNVLRSSCVCKSICLLSSGFGSYIGILVDQYCQVLLSLYWSILLVYMDVGINQIGSELLLENWLALCQVKVKCDSELSKFISSTLWDCCLF